MPNKKISLNKIDLKIEKLTQLHELSSIETILVTVLISTLILGITLYFTTSEAWLKIVSLFLMLYNFYPLTTFLSQFLSDAKYRFLTLKTILFTISLYLIAFGITLATIEIISIFTIKNYFIPLYVTSIIETCGIFTYFWNHRFEKNLNKKFSHFSVIKKMDSKIINSIRSALKNISKNGLILVILVIFSLLTYWSISVNEIFQGLIIGLIGLLNIFYLLIKLKKKQRKRRIMKNLFKKSSYIFFIIGILFILFGIFNFTNLGNELVIPKQDLAVHRFQYSGAQYTIIVTAHINENLIYSFEKTPITLNISFENCSNCPKLERGLTFWFYYEKINGSGSSGSIVSYSPNEDFMNVNVKPGETKELNGWVIFTGEGTYHHVLWNASNGIRLVESDEKAFVVYPNYIINQLRSNRVIESLSFITAGSSFIMLTFICIQLHSNIGNTKFQSIAYKKFLSELDQIKKIMNNQNNKRRTSQLKKRKSTKKK